MAVEIERKFLFDKSFGIEKIKDLAERSMEIRQGYLSLDPERTVRIRIQDDKSFLTIKGISNESGLSRLEFEYEIPKADAEEILKLCEAGVLSKTRYLLPVRNHTWELDVFHGDNEGLITAELELDFEAESFVKPEWIGPEITGEIKYYNLSLVKRPYKQWA